MDITKKTGKKDFIKKIDSILLNKYLAIPIFLCIMLLIFYLTFFSLGAFLSGLLENCVAELGQNFILLLENFTTEPFIISFFENGLFSAFSIVVKFLPQVILLFLFLNLIEQCGYLSRIAFIFEDFLSKFGLSGRSVYTVLMGFGCSVPAIMTSRTVASKNAKIKTAILTPYMSCSAKIPIYSVLGGAFFGNFNVFVILFLYLFGLALGFLVCFIMEKSVLKSKKDNFALEFTDLSTVKIKKVAKNVYDSAVEFFKRIFVLIICTNIIVWAISSFSFNLHYVLPVASDTNFFSKSILQVISEFLTPIFMPLGFMKWTEVAALVTGLVAKEIVVSTLALFGSYGGEETLEKQFSNATSLVYFSPAGAFSFLVFVLLYPACFASLGMLKQEIGIKWTFLAVTIQILLAYLMAFLAFNLFNFATFALFEIIGLVIILFLFAVALNYFFFKKKCAFCPNKCKNKCK